MCVVYVRSQPSHIHNHNAISNWYSIQHTNSRQNTAKHSHSFDLTISIEILFWPISFPYFNAVSGLQSFPLFYTYAVVLSLHIPFLSFLTAVYFFLIIRKPKSNKNGQYIYFVFMAWCRDFNCLLIFLRFDQFSFYFSSKTRALTLLQFTFVLYIQGQVPK